MTVSGQVDDRKSRREMRSPVRNYCSIPGGKEIIVVWTIRDGEKLLDSMYLEGRANWTCL